MMRINAYKIFKTNAHQAEAEHVVQAEDALKEMGIGLDAYDTQEHRRARLLIDEATERLRLSQRVRKLRGDAARSGTRGKWRILSKLSPWEK